MVEPPSSVRPRPASSLIPSQRTYKGVESAGRRETRQINENSGKHGHGSNGESEKLQEHRNTNLRSPNIRLLVMTHERKKQYSQVKFEF